MSSTRGVLLCGVEQRFHNNKIDYVQIGTLGNAIDFGNLSLHGGVQLVITHTNSWNIFP